MRMDYQGPCHDTALARSCLSRAPLRIRRESAWSSCAFRKSLLRLLTFFCKEYLARLCRVKAVSVEYDRIHFTSRAYFHQLVCTAAAILSFRCSFAIFSSPFFFFRNKTATGRKLSSVSSVVASKTPSGRHNISRQYSSNSKHKTYRLNLPFETKQFFNIGITISCLTRTMEKDLSHVSTSKTFVGKEIKLLHMRRSVSNALQKHCSNYGNRLDHK